MSRADFTPLRRTKIGVFALVVFVHVAIFVGLVRALAPDFSNQVVRNVTEAFTVTVTTREEPTPTPEPTPEQAVAPDPEPEGAAAPPGKKAVPREVVAPEPKITLTEKAAPKVASTGNADSSGARDEGDGTGAGGEGVGTGSGRSGSGQGGGGGVAQKAVKVAGDINSARDYPRATRDLRVGNSVVIALTVGTDGRVKNCRIVRGSPDPEADRITCRLATQRFRFRPAEDRAGNPVESVYGWQQRWFYGGER